MSLPTVDIVISSSWLFQKAKATCAYVGDKARHCAHQGTSLTILTSMKSVLSYGQSLVPSLPDKRGLSVLFIIMYSHRIVRYFISLCTHTASFLKYLLHIIMYTYCTSHHCVYIFQVDVHILLLHIIMYTY